MEETNEDMETKHENEIFYLHLEFKSSFMITL